MPPREIGSLLVKTTPRLLVVVFTIMILLFVTTGFLTKAYNREVKERAEQQYLAGEALAAGNRFEEAVELYTEALTLKRNEPQYLQGLALALVRAGHTSEAEAYLLELTAKDPANGIANLMLARIYLEHGGRDKAMQHYQRAIYGLWEEDPRGNRIRIRLELVGLFELAGQYDEMESELLRLLPESPDDPEMRKRLGRLFIAAQSYNNAAEIFTEVTQQNSRDAEAYAGLGDATFEMGHYLSARTAYRQALRHQSDDLQSQTQYDLATEIISLDPMVRGLGSATRLGRSRQLVERSIAGLESCLPQGPEVLPEEFRADLEQARKIVDGKIRQQRDAEAVEENIGLAERLERYRETNCRSPVVPDRALELVLRKLAG